MRERLTERQQRFVEYYAACANATEAARQAGYSRGRARVIGAENLTKPAVRAALAALTSASAGERIATMIERQEFLTTVMRDSNVEPKDRIKACELLGKMQGDFIERHEIETPPNIEVRVVRVTKDSR